MLLNVLVIIVTAVILTRKKQLKLGKLLLSAIAHGQFLYLFSLFILIYLFQENFNS